MLQQGQTVHKTAIELEIFQTNRLLFRQRPHFLCRNPNVEKQGQLFGIYIYPNRPPIYIYIEREREMPAAAFEPQTDRQNYLQTIEWFIELHVAA